jgi:hypothetical protein
VAVVTDARRWLLERLAQA